MKPTRTFTQSSRLCSQSAAGRGRRLASLLGLCALVPGSAMASVIQVPGDQPTIQMAIDAAATGDSVMVAPGSYLESINFRGKAIVVTSIDPEDEAVVAGTVIDAGGAQRGVTFEAGETRASLLTGFTITGGSSSTGGGVSCTGASPSVTHCVIQNNYGETKGGGMLLRDSSALVQDSTIRGNVTDGDGGGVHIDGGAPEFLAVAIEDNKADDDGGGIRVGGGATAIFEMCLIIDNEAEDSGGGFDLRDSHTTITTSKALANRSRSDGGAVFCSGGELHILDSVLSANQARYDGGGISLFGGAMGDVQHCTLLSNLAGERGGGLRVLGGATADVGSSILWQNWPSAITAEPADVSVRYSDVEGGWDGMGNINADPRFCGGACARHDAGLASDSPCAGSGEAGSDMGHVGVRCTQPQVNTPKVIAIPEDMATLKRALRWACDGDTILLAPGTYDEEETFMVDHAVHIRSTAPTDPEVVAATVLSGDDHRRVIDFVGPAASGATLTGITVTNGNSDRGGGIACRYGASPTIGSCEIVGNRAWDVGGIYCFESAPLIIHCHIADNEAVEFAGGIGSEDSSPTVFACTIEGNLAEADGGGGLGTVGRASKPLVTHSLIQNNSGYNGGGFDYADTARGLVVNCLVLGNTADDGSGFRVSEGSEPTIINTTISNNSGLRGGGVRNNQAHATLNNCIVWNNSPDEIYDIGVVTISVSNSDVRGGWPGWGNIDADPLFGDWHEFTHLLSYGSPCIDAGDPGLVDMIYDASDIWPELGPANGQRSDMGAYGGPWNGAWLWW